MTLAHIITTLLPSFTTKSNSVSDALRTKKTKCTEAGANPGSLQIPDPKRATVTIRLRCPWQLKVEKRNFGKLEKERRKVNKERSVSLY